MGYHSNANNKFMDDYKTNISSEGKNGRKKEYKEVFRHGFVDSCKIQVTKGRAKGVLNLLKVVLLKYLDWQKHVEVLVYCVLYIHLLLSQISSGHVF